MTTYDVIHLRCCGGSFSTVDSLSGIHRKSIFKSRCGVLSLWLCFLYVYISHFSCPLVYIFLYIAAPSGPEYIPQYHTATTTATNTTTHTYSPLHWKSPWKATSKSTVQACHWHLAYAINPPILFRKLTESISCLSVHDHAGSGLTVHIIIISFGFYFLLLFGSYWQCPIILQLFPRCVQLSGYVLIAVVTLFKSCFI